MSRAFIFAVWVVMSGLWVVFADGSAKQEASKILFAGMALFTHWLTNRGAQ